MAGRPATVPAVAADAPGLAGAVRSVRASARGLDGQLVGKRSRIVEGDHEGTSGCLLFQRWVNGAWATILALSPDGSSIISTTVIETVVTVVPGGLRYLSIGTGPLPIATSTNHMRFWYVEGTPAAPGALYFCMKNTAGGYEWVTVGQST